jgi:iron complex transport system ATP-binding protein
MEKINPSFFIEAKELLLGYDKRHPLFEKGISFALPTKATVALVGPNGAGKSTLINSLIDSKGILKGALHCYGKNMSQVTPRELSSFISIVPQEHFFPAELKVKNFLELAFLPTSGLWGSLPSIESNQYQKALETFNLQPIIGKVLKNLSSGERQRVFLARALLQKPKLILLDEPTNHLDPKASADFWRAIISYKSDQPLDILISTHDLKFVERECDWVLALDAVGLFYSGPKKEFFDSKLETLLFN